ncbi:N-acetyltransferase family protein [Salinarimonas sp.]|uniref:GNAT family N-acetyltransferase n=1 Tax=Salinarimonas sp. TaxID=2766526 RepID=UPI00391964E8
MPPVTMRDATRADLPDLVRMLADDPLGASREGSAEPLDPAYEAAFAAIAAAPGERLLVAEREGRAIGMLQLSLIPGLSRRGMTRAQIEGVRVAAEHRGAGIGEALVRHAIAIARAAGCGLVQLTTDKSRTDAHRFYARLGFVASHEGMKLGL